MTHLPSKSLLGPWAGPNVFPLEVSCSSDAPSPFFARLLAALTLTSPTCTVTTVPPAADVTSLELALPTAASVPCSVCGVAYAVMQ